MRSIIFLLLIYPLLLYGYQDEKSIYSKCITLHTTECNKGKASYCYWLGWMYEFGLGVEEDYERAFLFYKKACDLKQKICSTREGTCDYYWACNQLAVMYERGKGVKKDLEKAISIVKEGIDFLNNKCNGGDADGCVSLAKIYRGGYGISEDHNKEIFFLQKACEIDGRTCSELAKMYEDKDPQKSHLLYTEACNKGDTYACDHLGNKLKDSDLRQSSEFFQKAFSIRKEKCNRGDALSCVDLGYMYINGDGVEKNIKEAFSLWEKACNKLKNMIGCFVLALHYELDKRDIQKALLFYKKACDLGDYASCEDFIETQKKFYLKLLKDYQ